tara:strand:+ start:34252 stop:34596 length:345 start_codon:yes stop_codon:yes gene_type:complete
MKSTVLSLSVIAVSITLFSIMFVFGEIDFFENMSCDELKKYVSDIPRGEYPFETPFTPSQINYLDSQYGEQCGANAKESSTHQLFHNQETVIINLFHEGVSDYELTTELNDQQA